MKHDPDEYFEYGPVSLQTFGELIRRRFDDLYMAAGFANQRLYIIPSLDLVVVRQRRMSKWDDREFLSKLILGK